MPDLKFTYDSKDAIPEGLSDYYKEEDGTFRLQVSGAMSKSEHEGLQKALTKERDKNEELQRKISKYPDDFDPEKWDEIKHIDVEKIGQGDEQLQAQIENLQTRVKNLQDKVKQKDEKINEIDSKYKTTTKRGELKDALVAAGVTDDILLEAATERALKKHRVNVNETEDSFEVTAGDLDQPVEEWAKEWAKTDEGKRFVSAGLNGGGGSRNDGDEDIETEGNPFKTESMNITKASKIYRDDPQEAIRLAKEAGVKEKYFPGK